MLLSEAESPILARENPPGFGMSGTGDWQWKGGIFQLPCPPLRDNALVSLAIALPRVEEVNLPELIRLWQLLAELILSGGITGETAPT